MTIFACPVWNCTANLVGFLLLCHFPYHDFHESLPVFLTIGPYVPSSLTSSTPITSSLSITTPLLSTLITELKQQQTQPHSNGIDVRNVQDVLTAIGLAEHWPTFLKEGVTRVDTLKLLDDTALRELLPQMGPRAQLKRWLGITHHFPFGFLLFICRR
jgi:hypothetical protein